MIYLSLHQYYTTCQELCQVPLSARCLLFRGKAVEPRGEALHSLVQLGTIWHDSCALLSAAQYYICMKGVVSLCVVECSSY